MLSNSLVLIAICLVSVENYCKSFDVKLLMQFNKFFHFKDICFSPVFSQNTYFCIKIHNT